MTDKEKIIIKQHLLRPIRFSYYFVTSIKTAKMADEEAVGPRIR